MSDKKSKKSTDLEANLAKIANAKPRRRARKNDIYERFITRVENVDGNDNEDGEQASGISGNGRLAPLKNADKLSSYEPLSAAELELFASQQEDFQPESSLQRTSSKSTGVHLDFSDEDKWLGVSSADAPNDTVVREKAPVSHEANDNSESPDVDGDSDDLFIQSPIQPVLSKEGNLLKESAPASSKKALIVGMIVGSSLIAAMVVTLIFTGVLSTSTPVLATNPNSEKTNITNRASATNARQENTNAQQSATDISNQASKEAQTSVPSNGNTDNKDATNKDAIKDSTDKSKVANAKGTNGQPTAVMTNEAEAEPAITYEDFRQESQSTLYRETND